MKFILGSNKKNPKGFTLIELLVVVAIIGLLATISVVALNKSKKDAQMTRVKVEMNKIMNAIVFARGEGGKLFMTMTGSNCSYCSGSCSGRDLRQVPTSDTCYIRGLAAISAIENECNNLMMGLNKIDRDPWGSPYVFDENEGEGGGTTADRMYSAGPDGRLFTSDDITYTIPQCGSCR